MVLPTSRVQERGVRNQVEPCEGPRTLGFTLEFGTAPVWDLDYASFQPGRFEQLQGIYIDNSTNASPTTVIVVSTGQRVTIRANAQGFYTLLSANPIKLNFESAGGVNVNVFLLNFPVASAVWDV